VPELSVADPGGLDDGAPFPATAAVAGTSGTFAATLEGVSPTVAYADGSGTNLGGSAPSAVGTYTAVARFAGSRDYTAATATVAFTIAPSQAQVAWLAPSTIVYGTPLGADQLDASANVPGTFTYVPSAGTVLNAGDNQELSVTFTPQDLVDYRSIAGTTTIAVDKAAPALVLSAPGGAYNGTPFAAWVTIAAAGAAPAASLDNVAPTLTYYSGPNASGADLGATPPTAPGTYSVVASFPGAANYLAAQSAPATFTIGPAATSIALTASGGSAVHGQFVSFVASVTASPGISAGTVTFSDNGATIGVVPLNSAGTATLTTTSLALGSNAIVAAYSGTPDFAAGQSAPASVSVAPAATEVVLVPRPVFNKRKKLVALGLTAEIVPIAPGAGVPTGTVTFEMMMKHRKKTIVKTIGVAAVADGQATLALKLKQVLKQPITIIYSGDASDRTSTASVTLTQKEVASGPLVNAGRVTDLMVPNQSLRPSGQSTALMTKNS
jgi:hypothetical protein